VSTSAPEIITFVCGEERGARMSVDIVRPGEFVGPWLARIDSVVTRRPPGAARRRALWRQEIVTDAAIALGSVLSIVLFPGILLLVINAR